MQFFGYITITLLRLPTFIVRYKGQTNVSGQLETHKDVAAALSRKSNRRHGTISNPPEVEVDNSARSHNLMNKSLGRCHHTDKCHPWQYFWFLLLSAHHVQGVICVIAGFRCEVDVKCPLRGYYAASSGNSLPTLRDNPSVPFSRFKNPKRKDSWPLKMGPTGCRETSVRNYHYSLRNDSEEGSSRGIIYS
jgi:hypothetical protein